VIKASHSLALAAVAAFAAGAAQADIVVYTTSMDGPSESPPVASPGTGTSTVTIDEDLFRMHIVLSFQDLVGTTTVSHIHGPTAVPGAGVAGVMTPTPSFPDFPAGVTSGSYEREFDMTLTSSYSPGFLAASGGTALGAFSNLLTAMNEGRAYLNIHTTFVGSGEIRGFYQVPAPGAAALLGLGGLVAARRRRA